MLSKEKLYQKAEKHAESVKIDTIGEAELFIRRKGAEFLIWYNKVKDAIIRNGLTAKMKIDVTFDLEE